MPFSSQLRAFDASSDVVPGALPLPSYDQAEVVVPAPGPGIGNWAGGASATLVDDTFWLAYRVRRPLTEGRGVSVVVARSADGVHFETVCEVSRELFGAASFERPVVLRTPEGRWRLYLSCATPDSKHWWIEALEAATPEELPTGERHLVLPGSDTVAVKDPVIVLDGSDWHLWLCCHPLTEPGQEDRMTTRYLTSSDGLTWADHGEVLAGRAGRWDARGARVSTVLSLEPLAVLYDGRATAEQNWYETSGLAVAESTGGALHPIGEDALLAAPVGTGALRYASAVPLPDGSTRFYFEASRADQAHDLLTSLSTRSAAD